MMKRFLSMILAVVLALTFAAAAEQEVSIEKQGIVLDGVVNARQLGGYIGADGRKIKDGVLLRTGNLGALTEEGVRVLQEEYHLANIFDFRMESERDAAPDVEVPGAEYHWLPPFDSSLYDADTRASLGALMKGGASETERLIATAQAGIIRQMYSTILTSEIARDAYGQFFQLLVAQEPGTAALWHCSQGKDRAGMASALVLYALGVDEATIDADYLLSNAAYEEQGEKMKALAEENGLDEAAAKDLLAIALVQLDYFHLAIDSVKEAYGSVDGYLHDGLGLTDEDIQILRDKFLE